MDNIRYGRKKHGIRKELREKVNEWANTITDPHVKSLVKKNTIITGGSIASMLLGEPVNDYDVYLRDKESTLAVANYYVAKYNERQEAKKKAGTENKSCNGYKAEVRELQLTNIKGEMEDRVVVWMQSAGVASDTQSDYTYFETMGPDASREFASSFKCEESATDKYRVSFMSDNAITLTDKIQIVIRFYGDPDKIHSNYDFIHACNYYDAGTDQLVLKQEALEALLSRELIYCGSLYPVCSIFRTKKFIERHWRISAGQLLKIMFQISDIDLRDYNVLRDQMCGVDMAYMYQLLEALKSVDLTTVDNSYLCAIIDRVFTNEDVVEPYPSMRDADE